MEILGLRAGWVQGQELSSHCMPSCIAAGCNYRTCLKSNGNTHPPKKKKKKRCSRHCVNWTRQGRSETLSKRRKILCQNTNSCTLSVYTWGNAFVVCRVGREEYAAELEIFWEIYLIFFLAVRCIKGCHPHVWTVNMKRQLAAALHSLTTGNR